MVAKIETFESFLLVQKSNHDASGPVQSLAKELPKSRSHKKLAPFKIHSILSSLNVELVLAHRNAVNKLQRGPQSVEFRALVDVDDAIGRSFSAPNDFVVLQEGLDSLQDDLKDGEAAAETLPGQEVSFAGNLGLLGIAHLVNVLNDLERAVLGLQALLFRLGLFSL